MNLFWQEYTLFIVSAFSALICFASAWLFFLTFRYEKQLQTAWRSLGFLSLAIAFVFYILERKYGFLGIAGSIFAFFGFLSIYKGVLNEPKLSHLLKGTDGAFKKSGVKSKVYSGLKTFVKSTEFLLSLFAVLLVLIFLAILAPLTQGYISAGLELFSLIFIVATVVLQVRRLFQTKKGVKFKLQNIYPLIGYLFLVLRGITLFFFRFPEVDLVFLRKLSLNFGVAWQLSVLFTFLGFLFLAIWIWNFIKVRVSLRIYIVILSIAVVLSTMGSLVLSTFVFSVVETNNLQLMEQGARTQDLIMKESSSTALFMVKTMADDSTLTGYVESGNWDALDERTLKYLENSGADILRIYNTEGEIIATPSDIRDKGRTVTEDALLNVALVDGKEAAEFDIQEAILSDIMLARAVHPIMSGDGVVGAIELGYKFDSAFVDFSKEITGMDTTVFVDDRLSATTIKTEDGVSGWVGSEQIDPFVVENVIIRGNLFSTTVDRLGVPYYSAFSPILGLNDEIIGMVSVGVPTNVLFEDVRQRLLNTFYIITLMSIILAAAGNLTVYGVFRDKK